MLCLDVLTPLIFHLDRNFSFPGEAIYPLSGILRGLSLQREPEILVISETYLVVGERLGGYMQLGGELFA